jgi:hypothetical protein
MNVVDVKELNLIHSLVTVTSFISLRLFNSSILTTLTVNCKLQPPTKYSGGYRSRTDDPLRARQVL